MQLTVTTTPLACFAPSNFSVEMFFRNESWHEPYPLVLPGCEQRCPLLKFLQLTEPVISQDWKQECQIASVMKDTGEWGCCQRTAQTSLKVTTKELTCFVLCRTYCRFGCLWIRPLPTYRPTPDSTLPYQVPASWLPTRFQWRRRTALTIASAPPETAGGNGADVRNKNFLWWLSVPFHCPDCCFQVKSPTRCWCCWDY